jgi:hypothetical protein
MNMMMMSDENHRDIYISTVAVPPRGRCAACQDASRAHPGEAPGALEGDVAAGPLPGHEVSCNVSCCRGPKRTVPAAWLHAAHQIPGGVPLPHLPTRLPTQEGSGGAAQHQLLPGGLRCLCPLSR